MFGWFKRRSGEAKPTHEAALTPETEGKALGWAAIEDAFAKLYPGQTPRHWTHNGVMRMHDLRNPPENPFDGVNIYDGGSFWHFVSLGMSDLYERESQDEWSGFGYEFCFRLEKASSELEPPLWPINVMGSLARAAFTGSEFAAGDTVQIGPLDGRRETTLTALLLSEDPAFMEGPLETPSGKLHFLLLLGVEAEVRERARATGSAGVLREWRDRDSRLVTRRP